MPTPSEPSVVISPETSRLPALIETLPLLSITCLGFPSPSDRTIWLLEVLISKPPSLPSKLPIIVLLEPVVKC